MKPHQWEPIPGTLSVSADGAEAMTVNWMVFEVVDGKCVPQRCSRCGSVSLIDVPDHVTTSFEIGPWRKVSDDCDFDLVRNVMES